MAVGGREEDVWLSAVLVLLSVQPWAGVHLGGPQCASHSPKHPPFCCLDSSCREDVFLTDEKAEGQGVHITCPDSQNLKVSKFYQHREKWGGAWKWDSQKEEKITT